MNDGERLRAAAPESAAAALGPGMTRSLVERLAASERFAARLVVEALGRPDVDADARQVAALRLDPGGIGGVIRRAGAVWHARAIARVVEGARLRPLITALGPDAYALALEGRALAPPEGAAVSDDGIVEAVAADGAACWASWCARQPRSVAGRLTMLSEPVSPDAAHAIHGPPIVAWILDHR